jgi:hypothetical protein
MAIWISSGDDYGDLEPEDVVRSEDDWDVIIKKPVVAASSKAAALAQYDYGDAHEDHAEMVVAFARAKPLFCGGNKWAMEVHYKGRLNSSRPYKFQIDSYAERNTYENVLLPGESVKVPADVSQPRLGITVRYVSVDRPNTALIGTNVVPPLTDVDAPDNVFSFSTDVIVAYPDGWVLENRGGPNIPGSEIWLVEDKYVYYQPWRPRT